MVTLLAYIGVVFTSIGISHASMLESSATPVLDIWTPRKHNPVFTEPAKKFAVEIRADGKLPAVGWQAIVKNDLNEWACEVEAAVYGLIDHDSRPGWRLAIHLPADVPPELLELGIVTPTGVEASAPRSVQIVPDLEQDFYILHQSDQHLSNDEAVEPGGKSSTQWGQGSKQALEWSAPVINLINPRLVFETGDNMHLYNVADDWCGIEEARKRVDRFFQGVAKFTVPTVLTSGNHDMGWSDYVDIREWRKFYTKYVGQRAFSFRMGSMYILSSEWTSNEFLDWARADYESSWEDPGIQYRLLISHFYDGLEGWTAIATKEKPCDLLLVGHNHRTRVLQTTPYTVLSVGTAQDYQRAAFFDFRRTSEGWRCKQSAIHANEINVHRLLGDYGKPTVSADYQFPNDGSAVSNKVAINNTLPHDFYDGRVRFLMKKGRYTVKGGDILAQYDDSAGNQTAVLIKVNIRRSSETTVSITAAIPTIDNDAVWLDTDGNEISAQGGNIIQLGETYHWFGCQFPGFTAINHYTSNDLVNWGKRKPAITAGQQGIPFKGWVGRPWVMWNPNDNHFVMVVEWGGSKAYRNRYCFLTAPSIDGPWTFRSDKTINRLPDSQGVLYTLGDLGGYVEGNEAWMLYTFDKPQTNYAQAILKLDTDFMTPLPPTPDHYVEFTGGRWKSGVQEAASVFKRDNTYYYFTSLCNGWFSSETRYRTASDMAGPWTKNAVVRTMPHSDNSFNTQHDFVLPVMGSDTTTYMFCGDRWNNMRAEVGGTGRYQWFPLTFDPKGIPVIAAPDFAENGGDWRIDLLSGHWLPGGQ